ncbi:MAG: hypothetical protein HQ456_08200 [Polynucleobacter sp.]|nr:hypothetical protein [Polynucleobacter sp.]
MIAFFAAPAIPLFSYFIFNEVNWGWTPQMVAAINYFLNWKIAIIISVGCLGFYFGSLIFFYKLNYSNGISSHYNPLSLMGFKLLLLAAILLSYMSSPNATIFSGEYGGDQLNSLALSINFPAAYLVSYSIFIALAIDLGKDYTVNSLIKTRHLSLSIGFVAVFLQLIRGDREIFGLFIALMVLYIVTPIWSSGSKIHIKKILKLRLVKFLTFLIFAIIFLLGLGILRFTVSYGIYDLSDLFKANPWIMALTSFPAFFSSYQGENLLYGETYYQYFSSIIPTFFTSLFDFQRLIHSNSNLAASLVETGITSGGAHLALVALNNFGIFGVFFVMTMYGCIARNIEAHALKTRGLSIFVWLNLIAVVPIWFWYGEMAAIRAVMAAILSFGLINLTLFKRRRGNSFEGLSNNAN